MRLASRICAAVLVVAGIVCVVNGWHTLGTECYVVAILVLVIRREMCP